MILGGRLEEALTHYKRSKEFGVERAEMHIRNVSSSFSYIRCQLLYFLVF